MKTKTQNSPSNWPFVLWLFHAFNFSREGRGRKYSSSGSPNPNCARFHSISNSLIPFPVKPIFPNQNQTQTPQKTSLSSCVYSDNSCITKAVAPDPHSLSHPTSGFFTLAKIFNFCWDPKHDLNSSVFPFKCAHFKCAHYLSTSCYGCNGSQNFLFCFRFWMKQ